MVWCQTALTHGQTAHNLYFVQWNLYIATTILLGLPRQVVCHDRWICILRFIIYMVLASIHQSWEWLMLCLLMVWCKHDFNHRQTQPIVCFYLCWVCGLWSMLCLLMVWCQTACDHGQTQHGNLYLYVSFTIYMVNYLWYHPCCVHKVWSILYLPMSGAETAFSHGQTRHSTCTCNLSFNIYMAYDLWYLPCCVHKVWSILCLPMPCAETTFSPGQTSVVSPVQCMRSMVNAVPVVGLVPKRHSTIKRHGVCGIYILYAESYHELSIWYMLSSVLCGCGMINAVSADGLVPNCTQPWADTAWGSVFCTLSFAMYMVHDLYFHLRYVHELWPILCLLLAGCLTAPDHCQMQHGRCICVLSFTIYMVFNLCLYLCCMHGSEQCYVCWWPGAGLHSTISRHSMEFLICMLRLTMYIAYELCFHLCYDCEIWSMLCLLMVWYQPAFNHGQTQHRICISYMWSIVMYVAYDLCFQWCCVWKKQWCVCWWSGVKYISPCVDAERNLYFICLLKFCIGHWILPRLSLLMVWCMNVCNHWQSQHRICV